MLIGGVQPGWRGVLDKPKGKDSIAVRFVLKSGVGRCTWKSLKINGKRCSSATPSIETGWWLTLSVTSAIDY